jgi:hypothetical protein
VEAATPQAQAAAAPGEARWTQWGDRLLWQPTPRLRPQGG